MNSSLNSRPSGELPNRRDFFNWTQRGLTGAALSSLLLRDGYASQPKESHYVPKAKRVIHLCLCGGFSQVDTFDYKHRL